ncbi:phosphatase PAP2 family protein [bacterium]|nr:phosphatase PAP2 family protein [bacterium]
MPIFRSTFRTVDPRVVGFGLSLARWKWAGGWLLVWITAFVASLFLDGMIADYLNQPWSSGQRKALVEAMRAWGEASTIVVLLVGITLIKPTDRWKCVAIGLSCIAASLAASSMKPLTRRLRPAEVHARGLEGHWHLEGNANSSFPSGHVATAFSFARGLSLVYPPLRTLLVFAASGTAVSRMADSRHYLSDCLAGGLLGWAIATPIMQFFLRREIEMKP